MELRYTHLRSPRSGRTIFVNMPTDPNANDSDDFQNDSDALVTRLRVIEDQPLEARAAAFTQLHDELQATLEGGDSHR